MSFDVGAALNYEFEERQALMEEGKSSTNTSEFTFVNAAEWLLSEPMQADQVLDGIFDSGDKIAIIGPSKLRKSFFFLQMCLSLAAGKTFLGIQVPKPRNILLCQLEVKEHHYHKRIKRMAAAMGITSDDLGDRLHILNGRGLSISGNDGVARISAAVQDLHPDVIAFDPLYKLQSGVENAAEDAKKILSAFDRLAEDTGAAIMYVHHDAKGFSGDRDIRDRGAGSNVLGRDYDAAFTLTAHANEPDGIVVEMLLRNYRPKEPFSIIWSEIDNGYCFTIADNMTPEKKTSKTKATPVAVSEFLPIAHEILGDDEMEIGPFKAAMKDQTGLSDHRIRDFLCWATAGGNPHLLTSEDRGRGYFKKTIKRGKRSDFCE